MQQAEQVPREGGDSRCCGDSSDSSDGDWRDNNGLRGREIEVIAAIDETKRIEETPSITSCATMPFSWLDKNPSASDGYSLRRGLHDPN